jgi:hypothetical protein
VLFLARDGESTQGVSRSCRHFKSFFLRGDEHLILNARYKKVSFTAKKVDKRLNKIVIVSGIDCIDARATAFAKVKQQARSPTTLMITKF